MKRVTIAALVSALVFGILSTWLGPKMIAYWYAPPVPSGAAVAFNCTDAVTWAMNKLVLTQIAGSLVGAVIFLLSVIRWIRDTRSDMAELPDTHR